MNDRLKQRPHERELADPDEEVRPLPWMVVAIFVATALWGTWTVFTTPSGTAARYGDQRDLAALAADPPRILDGGKIYGVRCAACHQANGAGITGAFPPVANSEWVVADAALPLAILIRGLNGPITVKGNSYNGQMPSFRDVLDDEELAAVATWLRNNLGNQASAITPAEVAAARARWANDPDAFESGAALVEATGITP